MIYLLKIIDLINIGIAVKGKLIVIIPNGIILPLRGNNLLKNEKTKKQQLGYLKGIIKKVLIIIFRRI